jgi:hypothetical protein
MDLYVQRLGNFLAALDLEKVCRCLGLKILLLERQGAAVDQRIEVYQSAARALTRFDEIGSRSPAN